MYDHLSLEELRDMARATVRGVSSEPDFYGKLGIINDDGTEYIFDVPGTPGHTYCRLTHNGEVEPATCIARTALDPYVRMKFRVENGILTCYEPDWNDAINLYGYQAPSLMVPTFPASGRGGAGGLTPATGTVLAGDGQGFSAVPLATLLGDLGWLATGGVETLTIASGAVTTGDGSVFIIEAETGTADNLETVTLTGNARLIILIAAPGDTITLKDGVDNLLLNGGADVALVSGQMLLFYHNETDAHDLAMGGGTAAATSYTPTAPLTGTNVQDALDEAAALLSGGGGGGGGGGSDYVFITSDTLASDTPTLGLSSLPGTFQRLVILARLKQSDTNPQAAGIRLNGDSSALYDWQRVYGTGGGAGGGAAGGATSFSIDALPGDNVTDANVFSVVEITLDFYAAGAYTEFWVRHKYPNANTTFVVQEFTGQYRGAAPITSIDLFSAAGDIIAGSSIYAWGIGDLTGYASTAETVDATIRIERHDFTVAGTYQFDLTAIPGALDFDHLLVRFHLKAASGSPYARMVVNGDTTDANYIYAQVVGTSGGASGQGGALAYFGGLDATNYYDGEIRLPSYRGADNKQWWTIGASPGAALLIEGQWNNTAAVATLDFLLSSGNFAAGSWLEVLGVRRAQIGGPRYSDAAASNPPTQAELVAAFGPAGVKGAAGVLNVGGAGTDEYFCWSDGANWWYTTGTLAV